MSDFNIAPRHDEILTEGYALRNLWQRITTSVLLIISVGAVILIGGWAFIALMMVAAIFMDREWHYIAPASLPWKIAGIAYITLPIIAALALRDLALMALLFPIAVIVSTDIGGYIVGRLIGGKKLSPSISPGKTWSGLAGAVLAASVISLILSAFVPWPDSTLNALLAGGIITLLAQSGDLFESYLKRKAGVKDSGTLLPGHGGILDRLDGYIFALPAYLLFLIFWAEASV